MSPSEKIAQQVSYWVHVEQASVTVQRVVQTYGLSWPAALALLKKIPKEGNQYSVTQFTGTRSSTPDSGSNVTAFRMTKSAWDSREHLDESSIWYALAIESCTESIHGAHEKDASQFRDGIETFSISSSLHSRKHTVEGNECLGFASSIFVSESMKVRYLAWGKRKFDDTLGAPKAALARAAPMKTTATTACNFFSRNDSKALTKTHGQANFSKGNLQGRTTHPKETPTLLFRPKKQEVVKSSNQSTKQALDEEKENAQNKLPRGGNAGDVIIEDEPSDEENRVYKTPALKSLDEVATKTSTGQVERDEVEDVTLPNTSFTESIEAPHRRRKRKVMVEKMSTDERGYLFTETQAVWEDVPSSDDEKESLADASTVTKQAEPCKSKKPSRKTKALKQQLLIGFFSKK